MSAESTAVPKGVLRSGEFGFKINLPNERMPSLSLCRPHTFADESFNRHIFTSDVMHIRLAVTWADTQNIIVSTFM